MKLEPHAELRCSFCGKHQHEVRKIIGPTVYICDECVVTCEQLIDSERLKAAAGELVRLAEFVREMTSAMNWVEAPEAILERARALALGIETAARPEEG